MPVFPGIFYLIRELNKNHLSLFSISDSFEERSCLISGYRFSAIEEISTTRESIWLDEREEKE